MTLSPSHHYALIHQNHRFIDMILSRRHPPVITTNPITRTHHHNNTLTLPQSLFFKSPLLSTTNTNPFTHFKCRPQNRATLSLPSDGQQPKKNFWAAVTLIIGTAVGPGMLGLPSATIRSGPLPSTVAIILSWVYVVSSIVLIAELTFAAMDEDGLSEVSFTALATRALGANAGAVVAVVYACLSFSLLIACVAGIGSIAVQRFQSLNPVLVHAACPLIVGAVIGFFPFKAIDAVNRSLCALMLFSISALIAVGLSVGRRSLLGSFTHATWRVDAILPAVPVTVLTLGFHVITPFVCKIVGHTVYDARRAILVGGAVPLAMVLAWNAVVLGLAGPQPDLNSVGCADPIRLLLSVNSSALPAVQGFAFTALATSLIGYAVSLPKQVSDTVGLVSAITGSGLSVGLASQGGRVGFVVFSEGKRSGSLGWASFNSSRSKCVVSHDTSLGESGSGGILMCVVLGSAVLIASFFPMAFSVALDFAGVYANCFLFGVLPPVMAWIHRSRRPSNSIEVDILPGGRVALLLLFGIAIFLGFWH